MTSRFDEDGVSAISGSVVSAIDAATFGAGSWERIPAVLSGLFPGTFCGMWNLNFAENRLNCQSWANIDPDFAKSYADHFAYINPWMPYWAMARDGHVALSEQVCPSSSFSKTEFYNDWLAPQPGSEAAAGMKLVGDKGEIIQVVLHFPLSLSARYDQATLEVMRRIAGGLRRHIEVSRHLRAGIEKAVTAGALVERSRSAAFVVDGHRRVIEANALALELFAKVSALTVRNNRCVLADPDADARFGFVLAGRPNGLPRQGARIAVRSAAAAWQLVVAPLPAASAAGPPGLLLPPRQLFLVLVSGTDAGPSGVTDLSSLRTMFGLTPAEVEFCRRLLSGESLTEVAAGLGIAKETARDRVKSIFGKTGTSRQGELLLLLSRLS